MTAAATLAACPGLEFVVAPARTTTGQAAARLRPGDLAGREVSASAVRRYRLRWDLDDICQFLADFRAPHERTADTRGGLGRPGRRRPPGGRRPAVTAKVGA